MQAFEKLHTGGLRPLRHRVHGRARRAADHLAVLAGAGVLAAEAFAAEKPDLQVLPATPFDALLKLERRVSNDGVVSIGGNYYSVPDRTRRLWKCTSCRT